MTFSRPRRAVPRGLPYVPFFVGVLGLTACGSAAVSTPAKPPAGETSKTEIGRGTTEESSSFSGTPSTEARQAAPTGAPLEASSALATSVPREAAAAPVPPSSASEFSFEGTKVLHIGDSFAGALGIKLSELMKSEGVTPILEASDSSYIVDWAHRKSLDRLVWKYNPDLVIVTLGANELAMTEPSQRARAIKKVVEQIGPRPCVWVAIPYWDDKHNALMDVIKENSAPCVFHDTNALMDTSKMERIRDGIHPTEEARARWAKFFFSWLKAERRPTEKQPWALQSGAEARKVSVLQ